MKDANNTKEKILNAAEQVFAEKGFSRASVRAITQKADVNISLVNYHFRNKNALFTEVVNRHAKQIYEETRVEIETAKQSIHPNAEGHPLRIKDLLTIIQRTVVKHDEHDQARLYFLWHVLGAMTIHNSLVGKTCLGGTSPLISFLYDEFRQALHHLSDDTATWRFQFMLGALEKIINPVCMAGDKELGPSPMHTERAIRELSVLIEMA
jgi:AcrR family transcriptional regulator